MNKPLLSVFILSVGSLTACTSDVDTAVDDDEVADDSEATGTTSSELVVARVPRVTSRTASGSSIVFQFDRVVSAAEIPIAAMRVDVVRRAEGKFTKTNVLKDAVLAADGRSLTMNLTEAVRKGTAYYARGKWNRCTRLGLIKMCKVLPAEFGQIIATRRSPVVVNGNIFEDFTARAATFKAASPAQATDAARVTRVALAEAAPIAATTAAGPGTFRVKSMTPVEISEANTRDLRTVTIEFQGGTIDCSKIAPGEAGFKLYSRSPDIGAQQLMFDDPESPTPTSPNFRGDLRCQEAENRVLFTPPGRLFGDVQYMVEATFASKEGDELKIEKDFYTERPGIRVTAVRVDNRYGTHDTCDSDGLFGGDNYCDIYVTSGVAGANIEQTARIPDTGDFSGMRFFDTDAVKGRRDLSPAKVLFQSDKPVGVALELDLFAHDADSTTAWKTILEVAGKVASTAGTAIAAAEPQAGAIAIGVGETLTVISAAIPKNDDDLLGSAKYTVTRDQSRWGTTHAGPHVIPLDKTASDSRGPVNVYVYFEEFPAPWRPQGPFE